jgi:hypothetical protein
MAYKEGKDFNDSYEGSTGYDGESRSTESLANCGPWEKWSDKSDGVRIRNNVAGDHTLVARGDASGQDTRNEHIHYYNDDNGDRVALVKEGKERTEYISEKIGNAVRNFMGW